MLARAAAPDIVAAEKAGEGRNQSVARPGQGCRARKRPCPRRPAAAPRRRQAAVRGPQAAPFDSDTPPTSAAPASWQSRVLGHLAHFKRYPGDARQRKRAGAAWVRFQVDRDGKLLASELSPPRARCCSTAKRCKCWSARNRCRRRPASVLRQGTVTVTLPVSFKLMRRATPPRRQHDFLNHITNRGCMHIKTDDARRGRVHGLARAAGMGATRPRQWQGGVFRR